MSPGSKNVFRLSYTFEIKINNIYILWIRIRMCMLEMKFLKIDRLLVYRHKNRVGAKK